ncbi:MAG: ParB N-terminal domain-containing protein [Bacteroidales bacterium]|nr:ParB N-terminal domain-containing protein [Bacteroidales bacterium]
MRFENIDINELLPDAKNPRKDLKPEDPEFNKINTSIEKFGFLEPIVFNTRTKKILGGHQRIKTLKHRGVSELHVIKLGAYSWGFTDNELKELTPSEENAANIALNKAQGDWDMDQLIINLQELKDEDFDIELTGFDDIEFSQFIEDMNTLKTPIPESEREYDESIASDVEMITCPHCGEVFPK